NVPWDQALDVILKTKDLDMESRGGIIRVAPAAKIAAERAARLALAVNRRQMVPTTVRLIPVNYAVASQLAPQIKELLSERGRVTFDQRTNVIIVEDIRDNLDQAERLVRTLDTQTPQVLIEARMVEASTDFTRSLGIQWGGGLFFSERGGNPTGLIFPNNVGIVGAADSAAAAQIPGILPPSNFAVNVPADGLTTGLGMNLGSIGNFGFLNARLTAAETTGQAKTITAPRVTTLDNRTARIFQGQQILVQVTTQNVINTTTVNAQLSLDVTPHVTADGSVLMNINLQNNQPGAPVPGALPTINTKGATTELLVKDGDTAVIGGIYTRSLTEGYQKTPFLSQLPLLGWLFKSYRTSDSRSEMLVFLTPRIINRRSSTPMAQ
ncbi:MAG: type IV pilus secretin PilQ, partial [Myxococcota bacterium]